MENTNNSNILKLLSFTEAHNHFREALNRATGEHFNIFTILGIRRREVTTHSPVLAELLNPKGNHGQGAAFLKLFLDKLKITYIHAESATVKKEVCIGPVNEDAETGGRIDILIKDGNGNMILIENKIDAVDQKKQMKRYYNYAKSAPKYDLFYLTLDGHEPDNFSDEDLKCIKYKCIDYKTEVLAWLINCRKEAACLPNVRETINQYIHLIEELAKINMDQELIIKITESKESLQAFNTICKAFWPVRLELINRLDGYLNSFAAKYKLERVDSKLGKAGPLSSLGNKNDEFCFTTNALRQHDLQITFAFEEEEIFFGFRYVEATDDKGCPVGDKLWKAFAGRFPNDLEEPTGNYYPASAWWTKYRLCDDIFEAICSGDFKKDLDEKLGLLTKIANDVCEDKVVTQ